MSDSINPVTQDAPLILHDNDARLENGLILEDGRLIEVETNTARKSIKLNSTQPAIRTGSGTLTMGAATVLDAEITDESIIMLTNTAGTTNSVSEDKSARVEGESFDVVGTGSDTFDYVIFEPQA